MPEQNDIPFEYRPNNTFKPEHDSTANTNHDGHDLFCDGFLLKRHRINSNGSINWICKKKANKEKIGCPGTITIKEEEIVRRVAHVIVTESESSKNNSVHEPITNLQLEGLNFINKCKQECSAVDADSVRKIWQKQRAELSANSEFSNEELVKVLPNLSSVMGENTLYT